MLPIQPLRYCGSRAAYDIRSERSFCGSLPGKAQSYRFSPVPRDLFPPNPTTGRGEPEGDMAVSPESIFVLDGQQRLTSLFRVIFSSRQRAKAARAPSLLVSLSPAQSWANELFRLSSRSLFRQMRNGLLVDADVLFAGFRGEDESLAVTKAIGEWVPRAQLNCGAVMDSQHSPDRIGNLTLLYRADNEHLSGELPGSHLKECSPEALKEHVIPEDQALWRIENYAIFCERREKYLAVRIASLLRAFGIE